MVNIFLRALRRAQIPVKFTEGFHPKAKISFDDPLPIGLESREERFMLTLPDFVNPQTLSEQLNAQLPAGLCVHHCQPLPLTSNQKTSRISNYWVRLQGSVFDDEKLDAFLRSTAVTVSRLNQKGKLKIINLKDMVINIKLLNSTCLEMTLKSEPGNMVRPAEVLRHIFNIAENQIKRAKIVKLRA